MANKILQVEGGGTPDQIVFADHATDFNPTAANDLRDATSDNRTNCQLALASVAAAGFRQSTKVDLGSLWAPEYAVRAAIEWAAGIDAGETVSFYWCPSQSATAANANVAGASGSDSAYTGYSANASASIEQAIFIGSMTMTAQATATIQVGFVGTFRPLCRYGSLIVRNNADDAFHSDDVEMHVVFDPIVPEVQ